MGAPDSKLFRLVAVANTAPATDNSSVANLVLRKPWLPAAITLAGFVALVIVLNLPSSHPPPVPLEEVIDRTLSVGSAAIDVSVTQRIEYDQGPILGQRTAETPAIFGVQGTLDFANESGYVALGTSYYSRGEEFVALAEEIFVAGVLYDRDLARSGDWEPWQSESEDATLEVLQIESISRLSTAEGLGALLGDIDELSFDGRSSVGSVATYRYLRERGEAESALVAVFVDDEGRLRRAVFESQREGERPITVITFELSAFGEPSPSPTPDINAPWYPALATLQIEMYIEQRELGISDLLVEVRWNANKPGRYAFWLGPTCRTGKPIAEGTYNPESVDNPRPQTLQFESTLLQEGDNEITLCFTGRDDSTLGTARVTRDTTPPETEIRLGPEEGEVTGPDVRFGLSGSFTVYYECSLDGAEFERCVSSQEYLGLQPGEHTFMARVWDSAGNADPTPATRTWSVR